MSPYDRWGFPQKLNSQDEDAFLSMANRLGRRSEEIKVSIFMSKLVIEQSYLSTARDAITLVY